MGVWQGPVTLSCKDYEKRVTVTERQWQSDVGGMIFTVSNTTG